MTREREIAVIGAGLAGLTAAAALSEAGHDVVLLEKSRGSGGRLATRRAGDLRFDHGAQYIRPRDPAFAALLDRLGFDGAAGAWDAVPGALVGTPGMSGLVKPLAEGLDIRTGLEVASVVHGPQDWHLRDGNGATLVSAGALLVAIPAPQARRLLADYPAAAPLDAVRFAPNWTLMAAFETPLDLPQTARVPDADLAWIARDAGKPGRSALPEAWVVQASAAWSRAHLEEDRETVCATMLDLVSQRAGGILPEPVYAAAHRWRYAQAEVPLGAPCVSDPDTRLVIAGDWCLGTRVEDAWASGRAAAQALAAMA